MQFIRRAQIILLRDAGRAYTKNSRNRIERVVQAHAVFLRRRQAQALPVLQIKGRLQIVRHRDVLQCDVIALRDTPQRIARQNRVHARRARPFLRAEMRRWRGALAPDQITTGNH